jgi:hypothetical protein
MKLFYQLPCYDRTQKVDPTIEVQDKEGLTKYEYRNTQSVEYTAYNRNSLHQYSEDKP